MALTGALCLVAHAVTGFTNKSLCGQVAGLFGKDYSSSQMS
jgi:5,10-methenyltetrahydromethanopterin hydrogenase